jgi:hypothetical protein
VAEEQFDSALRRPQKVLTPQHRAILVWSMSLSPFTRFLLDAAFTAAQTGGDFDTWLSMAVQSHPTDLTDLEWIEVKDMILANFPDLIAAKPRLRRRLDAKQPHPTCECGCRLGG